MQVVRVLCGHYHRWHFQQQAPQYWLYWSNQHFDLYFLNVGMLLLCSLNFCSPKPLRKEIVIGQRYMGCCTYLLFNYQLLFCFPYNYINNVLFINMHILQYLNKGMDKSQQRRYQDEDESSSLGFLDDNKQEQQRQNQIDQQNNGDAEIDINSMPGKRKRDWQEAQADRNANGYKKKQRAVQQQVGSIQSTFLYKPGVQLPNLFNFTNQTIKVIIASQYITKENPAYIRRKIYGTDTYSSNSDCVCIGVHYGLLNFNTFSYKKYDGVQINFKVIKPKKNYGGSLKNGLQSDSIKNFNGNAIKPQSLKMLTSLGSIQNLQRYAANMHVPIGKGRTRPKPQNLSSIVPLPQSNLVFNMNNQPAIKYDIFNIADKGFDKSQFMLRKLDNRVLYLQTESKQKYELSKYIQKVYFQAYRFAKVKTPIKFDNQYFSLHPPPLDGNDLEIIYPLVQWDQISFGVNFVKIKQLKIQHLASFKYYSNQPK